MATFRSSAHTLLIFGSLVVTLPAAAAPMRYDEARSRALRDPKVQAAFQKANERLDDQIVRLEPALERYVKSRPSREGMVRNNAGEEQATTPGPVSRFSRLSRQSPPPEPVRPAPRGRRGAPAARTHTVVAGETLGGLAKKYGVSVQSLQTANKIADPSKVRVGQTLMVPARR